MTGIEYEQLRQSLEGGQYQPLFDLMHDKWGLILLQSEMDEISAACEILNGVEYLRQQNAELREALQGIIEIGKRDMSNSKYDGYFDFARAALDKYENSPASQDAGQH